MASVSVRTRVTLVGGLALVVTALAVTLTRSPPSLAGTDGTPVEGTIAYLNDGAQACQGRETLPRGATAVRLSLYAGIGPRVSVAVLSGGRALAAGTRSPGWRGQSPTVPLVGARQGASGVRVCFKLGFSGENVGLDGIAVHGGEGALTQGGRPLGVRLRIEFLRSGNRSWASLESVVARKAGLGRWAAGTWVALLAFALAAGVAAGASWLVLRELT